MVATHPEQRVSKKIENWLPWDYGHHYYHAGHSATEDRNDCHNARTGALEPHEESCLSLPLQAS
jgi:hypothetical protein